MGLDCGRQKYSNVRAAVVGAQNSCIVAQQLSVPDDAPYNRPRQLRRCFRFDRPRAKNHAIASAGTEVRSDTAVPALQQVWSV